jgi:3-hydroxy-9,10-secoandrosta-1,3,5(10)-triene-9,17-dione monooxygenase
MAESAGARGSAPTRPDIPVPEPGLTGEQVIARARALIPRVREQQEEAERLGHHTEALDREFVNAGLYRMLQPRTFGGYEFDVPTFWKAMLAVATGDPGTGWGLTLGAHHAMVAGAHFGAEGQRAIFGPDGEFRCPHRPVPAGTAEPVDGGYLVTGTWDYCSGISHATHFMGNAMVTAPGGAPHPGGSPGGAPHPDGGAEGAEGADDGQRPATVVVVIPRDQVTVLDDWGDGAILGMNSSGSNSVRVDPVFVPAERTSPGDWTRITGPAPGAHLHGNGMYYGRIYAVYHVGLVIPLIGAARAALEDYEQIITTRLTYFPPQIPRYTHPDYQRAYGYALALTDSAEGLVMHVGEQYMELGQRWQRTGQPFTREEDVRLFAMAQQAGQLAVRALETIFSAAGSSAAKRGQRLQRYYRDMSMYHGHIAAQYLSTAGDLARVHFGLPDGLF